MDFFRQAVTNLTFSFLALAGIAGALALISPKAFAVVAGAGGYWITTPKNRSFLESPIDIDQFVIRHSRKFGMLVLMVVSYVTLYFIGRIDPSWTPVFLLLVSGFSVLFALAGFIELGGKVVSIENQLADARIDPLTRLANRRAFDNELKRRLSEQSRKGSTFCVALFDIDQFKEINDKLGHLVGDMVLSKGIADVVSNTVRSMDVVARYGGDEFAIIFPATQLSEASKAVENVRSAVADGLLPLEDEMYTVTVSIGVAEAQNGDDVVSIMKRADAALYTAKRAGRNRAYQNNGKSCERISEEEALPR